MDTEKDLSLKILNITMLIKDQYPELSKYLEEMKVTIPDKSSPEITKRSLEAYYDSLNALLSKYVLELPGGKYNL
ncbi:MAG TPA: hypothetical protein VNY73_04640 [Bacteroidia bacterium]|jgi:hypothetical protein|nr:hypothetical protein [Bacteroidia bacterium]